MPTNIHKQAEKTVKTKKNSIEEQKVTHEKTKENSKNPVLPKHKNQENCSSGNRSFQRNPKDY